MIVSIDGTKFYSGLSNNKEDMGVDTARRYQEKLRGKRLLPLFPSTDEGKGGRNVVHPRARERVRSIRGSKEAKCIGWEFLPEES